LEDGLLNPWQPDRRKRQNSEIWLYQIPDADVWVPLVKYAAAALYGIVERAKRQEGYSALEAAAEGVRFAETLDAQLGLSRKKEADGADNGSGPE
jgi:hypothetical protein